MATHMYLGEGAVTVNDIKKGRQTFPVLVRTSSSDYEVLENCPTFVKICGEMQSCIKGLSPGSGKLVSDKTILGLHGVIQNDKTSFMYLKGTVGDCVIYFREDQVANMVEVDDPGSYSLMELKQKSIKLPLQIMFDSMPSSDIVLKDGAKKDDAYAIFHGPLELLQFIRISQIIAWTKVEQGDGVSRKLAIIQKSLCDTLEVRIHEFKSENDKNDFLDANFTDYQENTWIGEHVFVIPTQRKKQFNIPWLKRPSQYMSVPDDLPEDLSKPCAASSRHIKTDSGNVVTPKLDLRKQHQNPKPKVQLATSLKEKEDGWLKKCTDKAKLGFDKIHKEMLCFWETLAKID